MSLSFRNKKNENKPKSRESPILFNHESIVTTEFQLEDECEKTSLTFLKSDKAGKRAPKLWKGILNCLLLLTKLSSCYWKCHGGDHNIVNLIRKFCNTACGLSRKICPCFIQQ